MSSDSAKAFAPASVANVAVGFDLMGFSAGVTGDKATVEKIGERKVVIGKISGFDGNLPTDVRMNTATAGLVQLIDDLDLSHGFKVSLEKGIPLGSGLGGSAASAVAAIVAAGALLEKPLSKSHLLKYALIGEKVASGSFHADNVAASLFGGLTLSRVGPSTSNLPSIDVIELPIPNDLWCVLVHPHIAIETKQARGILKQEISLPSHIQSAADLAFVMSALYTSDFDLIARYLRDTLIEPQRAHLIPGFKKIQKAALSSSGSLGCSISGAGPTVFAWARGQSAALEIKNQMVAAADQHGPTTSWAFQLKHDGARLLA